MPFVLPSSAKNLQRRESDGKLILHSQDTNANALGSLMGEDVCCCVDGTIVEFLACGTCTGCVCQNAQDSSTLNSEGKYNWRCSLCNEQKGSRCCQRGIGDCSDVDCESCDDTDCSDNAQNHCNNCDDLTCRSVYISLADLKEIVWRNCTGQTLGNVGIFPGGIVSVAGFKILDGCFVMSPFLVDVAQTQATDCFEGCQYVTADDFNRDCNGNLMITQYDPIEQVATNVFTSGYSLGDGTANFQSCDSAFDNICRHCCIKTFNNDELCPPCLLGSNDCCMTIDYDDQCTYGSCESRAGIALCHCSDSNDIDTRGRFSRLRSNLPAAPPKRHCKDTLGFRGGTGSGDHIEPAHYYSDAAPCEPCNCHCDDGRHTYDCVGCSNGVCPHRPSEAGCTPDAAWTLGEWHSLDEAAASCQWNIPDCTEGPGSPPITVGPHVNDCLEATGETAGSSCSCDCVAFGGGGSGTPDCEDALCPSSYSISVPAWDMGGGLTETVPCLGSPCNPKQPDTCGTYDFGCDEGFPAGSITVYACRPSGGCCKSNYRACPEQTGGNQPASDPSTNCCPTTANCCGSINFGVQNTPYASNCASLNCCNTPQIANILKNAELGCFPNFNPSCQRDCSGYRLTITWIAYAVGGGGSTINGVYERTTGGTGGCASGTYTLCVAASTQNIGSDLCAGAYSPTDLPATITVS